MDGLMEGLRSGWVDRLMNGQTKHTFIGGHPDALKGPTSTSRMMISWDSQDQAKKTSKPQFFPFAKWSCCKCSWSPNLCLLSVLRLHPSLIKEPRINPSSATCKANALPAVLYLQFHRFSFYVAKPVSLKIQSCSEKHDWIFRDTK